MCFNDCSLIEKDGINPYKKGKRIFGSRLVSLLRQALKMKDSDEEVQSSNACAIASSWAVGNFNQCGDGCSLLLLKMRLTGLTTSRVHMVMMNPLKPFSGEAGCLNTFLMCLYIKMHRAWGINSKKQKCLCAVAGPRSHCNYRTWWDSSHDCHAVMVAMYFLERTGQ